VNWPTNKMYPFFQKSQWAFPSFLQVWQELTSVIGAGYFRSWLSSRELIFPV
jgi:hypothetical protein